MSFIPSLQALRPFLGKGATVALVALGTGSAAEACYRCTLQGSTVGCIGGSFSGYAYCQVSGSPGGAGCSTYGYGCS
jgi:hypothetical protein